VRVSFQEPITRSTVGLLAGVFPSIGVLDDRLRQAAGERLAQAPHRRSHLCQGRCRLLELCFQPIKPLVKAGMELPAQGVPLFSCTDLLERDNLSCSHRGLLMWQDDVTVSCSL